MNRYHPYCPPLPQIPADIILVDTCDMRRFVNPLTGILHPRGNALGYRYASPDGDGFPAAHLVTHSHTDHCSLLTAHSSHTFSAKERDTETGLSYFGSRYYSSDLSIWLSVDPMSDKYPSLSPYVYCADNPVKLVDPNGEEIVITTSKNEDGNKIVNIKFTAVLVDKTRTDILTDDGLTESQMNDFRDQIVEAITQLWSTTVDDGTIVNVDVDLSINPKGSLEYTVSSRHRIYLGERCDDGHVAEAAVGGTFMRLSPSLIKGECPNGIKRTVAHEFGHLLGLEHNDIDMKNIMYSGGSWANITSSQVNEILKNYPNNMFSRSNNNFYRMCIGHQL